MLVSGGTTMHLSSFLDIKKIGSLAMILVTLWLGGVGCSSCCATGLADACCDGSHKGQFSCATENEKTASCEASPTERSCCQKSSQSSKNVSTGAVIKSLGT